MNRTFAVRTGLVGALLTCCLVAVVGCAPHLALSIRPNPVVLGRFDTHAVIDATVTGEGLGPLYLSAMQVKLWGGARYLGHDLQLYSRTIPIGKTVFVLPFVHVTRAYDVPISPWEVAVGNARYATVEVLDGAGTVIGASRIDFAVDPRVAHKFSGAP